MNAIERLREYAPEFDSELHQTRWDEALAAVDALYQAAKHFIDTMGEHPVSGEPRGYSYDSNAAAVALSAAVRRVEGE